MLLHAQFCYGILMASLDNESTWQIFYSYTPSFLLSWKCKYKLEIIHPWHVLICCQLYTHNSKKKEECICNLSLKFSVHQTWLMVWHYHTIIIINIQNWPMSSIETLTVLTFFLKNFINLYLFLTEMTHI